MNELPAEASLRRYSARLLWVPLVVALLSGAVALVRSPAETIPLALTGLALVAFADGRRVVAGVLLGLAICGGSMPVAVALAVLVAVGLREGWRRLLQVGAPAAGALLIGQLAFGQGPAGVVQSYLAQIDAPVGPGSVWYLLGLWGPSIGHAGWLGFAALFLALGCLFGLLRSTGQSPRVGSLIAVVVLSSVLLAPEVAPHVGVWVLLAVLVARPYPLEVLVVGVAQAAYAAGASGWLGPAGSDPAHWLHALLTAAPIVAQVWILVLVFWDLLWPARDRLRVVPPATLAARHVEADPPSGWPAWRPAVVTAAVAVGVTRVMYVLGAYAAQWLTTRDEMQPEFTLETWLRWDAEYFIEIAQRGYAADVASGNAAAFFPLFPLSVRGLSALGLEPLIAGMLISLLATFVACVYLHRLAKLHGFAGRHSQLYLLLFPTAAFLVAPYTEALFLAGAIPAFYYAYGGRPWPAALFAAVAVGTRTVGLLVLVGVAFELARRVWPDWRKLLMSALAMAAATIPFWAYGLHLREVAGAFFAFQHAQKEGWGREFVGLVDGLVLTWNTWEGGYSANNIFAWRLEVIFAGLSVLLLLWLMWRGYVGYSVYVGATMIIALGNTWYFSNPRLALAFFPFAFALAALTRRREAVHSYVVVLLAGLAMVGAVVLTSGRWFF